MVLLRANIPTSINTAPNMAQCLASIAGGRENHAAFTA